MDETTSGAGGGTFLRFDRPELVGTSLVLRAVPSHLREQRRRDAQAPLGYLYERYTGHEPETDEVFAAGHYDSNELVWCFSGEVVGITGITMTPPPRRDE